MSIKAICLLPNQSIKSIEVSSQLNLDNLKINELPFNKNCGKGDIQRECDFGYNDITVSIFAWTYGRAGQENRHELPPPIDNELYFGNVYVFAHKNDKLVDFTEEEYNNFYETAYGGFDEIGSEDEWSEEDEEIVGEFDDFIISENKDKNEFIDENDSDYIPSETDFDTNEDVDEDDSVYETDEDIETNIEKQDNTDEFLNTDDLTSNDFNETDTSSNSE